MKEAVSARVAGGGACRMSGRGGVDGRGMLVGLRKQGNRWRRMRRDDDEENRGRRIGRRG